ncbi:hypothetical protein GTQ34_15935 [Muricauda sp. JGD-17]|uniref:Uncharacterized protein n=1 Tax=Flagellimonas ochracea TaxID=2696472 RepID=A0A964WYN2_9FLAO|nr:hypothetical protein [Allomuricauda ochracea]NAY93401.1 hypothetical protein [Allomuricauda ochracea]
MKTYVLMTALLFCLTGCKGQDKKEGAIVKEDNKKEMDQPKGSWKVDKEFDESGNLIRYDSIYSWSSSDSLNDLSGLDKDSLLNSFESKFYSNFSQFRSQGFEDIFEPDSLFSKRFFDKGFFDSDFGEEFIELDNYYERMLERRKRFLEKYRSNFNIEKKDSL